MLGLERLLAEEEPHLADGTTLSAHQVDALSGTLIALESELLIGRNGKGERRRSRSSTRARSRSRATSCPTRSRSTGTRPRRPRRRPRRTRSTRIPGAARRFWFEHATGAGQDGRRARLRRGLAHRRHPDPHPPAQPGGPVPGRAARPRLQEAHLRAAPEERRRRAARRRPGDGRDLPVVRAQRRQGLGRVHDRHLRRGAHRARREDERVDPPVDRSGVRGHDGDRRADRAPRHRPLPDADVALRPRAGRAARRDRAASLRAHPAGRGRALDRERAAAPRRGGPGLRPGRAGRAARPDAVQPGGGRPLQDALQGPAGRRLLGRREARAQRRQGVPRRGDEGEGRLRRDAQARAHARPRRLRARRDRRAGERAAARRGLELAAGDGVHAPGADGLEAHLPAARRPRDAPHARQGVGHRRGLRPPGDAERRPRRDAALAARPRRLPRRRDRGRPGAPRPRPAAARRAARRAGHGGRRAARAGLRARAVADRRGAPELGRAAGVGDAGRARAWPRTTGGAPRRCCTSTRPASCAGCS